MRLSFGYKMGLAVTLLVVTTTSAGVLFFYVQTRDIIWEQMGGRVKDIARTGLFLLTPAHREIVHKLNAETEKASRERDTPWLKEIAVGKTGDLLSEEAVQSFQSRPDFQALAQVMRQIKNGSRSAPTPLGTLPQKPLNPDDKPLIRFVYIFTAIPESPDFQYAKFIVDGDYEAIDDNANGKIDDDEAATSIGMLYNIQNQDGARRAFAGEVAANSSYTVDQWGIWVSAFAPIQDAQGKTIAVLGVDFRADTQFNTVQRLWKFCLGIIGASLLFALLLSFTLARWLAGPLTLLREGAERVRARDYSARVEIEGTIKDEFDLLAETFNQMVSEVRDHAAHLEEKVAARTHELQDSLTIVRELKEKQDADYFLTNLLATPLFKNYNKSNAVRTEFYIKQMKEFSFRNRVADLGGDLCVTGNLRLRGRRYTMFVNADAMGKSMQGAGGALIMGSVINSIMARSAANRRDLDIDPERWMRAAYRELHQVFLTFDGSMYVSCILGLIDDETGSMLFFNAEHPFTVLYREGKARFIEEAGELRKLGSALASKFVLHRLQLHTGDVIIVGSDGRDDINLARGPGLRSMNEDETLFLRIVETSRGDLPDIVDRIRANGEVTDDLSLIRIEYLGADGRAHPENVTEPARAVL